MMAEPLSPAAQAILADFGEESAKHIAAAFRALADAVVPEETSIVQACEFRRQRQWTRKQILSIATELENANV